MKIPILHPYLHNKDNIPEPDKIILAISLIIPPMEIFDLMLYLSEHNMKSISNIPISLKDELFKLFGKH